MATLPLNLAPLVPSDRDAVERLTERAFGPGRFARTAFRLREGREPSAGLSFVATVGTLLVGSVVVTPIRAGAGEALLLGPLVVDPAFEGRGIGRALVERSVDAARAAGHRLIVLVGDATYYDRFGFRRVPEGRLVMPGPVDPSRLLALEIEPGALDAVAGSGRAELHAA